jgi:hypothetical protein
MLVASGPRGARAEEPACPSRASVERALAELASKDPGKFPLADALGGLELGDAGARYQVSVGGRRREYADTTRDCERRARVAAVYIALVLTERAGEQTSPEQPTPAPSAAPAKTPTPSPPPEPPRAPAPEPPRRLFFDGGGRLAFAPVSPGIVVLPGVELGAAYQPGALGARLALAVPVASGTMAVGSATARLARYPLYLALRHSVRLEPFALALDAGVEAALLAVRREGGAPGTTRVDAGARTSLTLGLASARLSPYLALLAEWVPRRFGLALEPDGVVRETPAFWLGASAGAELAF